MSKRPRRRTRNTTKPTAPRQPDATPPPAGGDRVRFNHHTRPQYLRGVEGVVIELDQHTATVCIHEPVGRFRSGTVRQCPPLLLDRLHPAA